MEPVSFGSAVLKMEFSDPTENHMYAGFHHNLTVMSHVSYE